MPSRFCCGSLTLIVSQMKLLLVALSLMVALATPAPSFVLHARKAAARATRIAAEGAPATAKAFLFDQVFDHFGVVSNATWKQRYWVDTTYWNPALPGPLFVQLGEEAAASPAYASSLAMASYGKAHGALLVAIEHRFYGDSQPFASLADLSLLSVDQGLADFARVIQAIKQEYASTNTIVFGCSYIGAGKTININDR